MASGDDFWEGGNHHRGFARPSIDRNFGRSPRFELIAPIFETPRSPSFPFVGFVDQSFRESPNELRLLSDEDEDEDVVAWIDRRGTSQRWAAFWVEFWLGPATPESHGGFQTRAGGREVWSGVPAESVTSEAAWRLKNLATWSDQVIAKPPTNPEIPEPRREREAHAAIVDVPSTSALFSGHRILPRSKSQAAPQPRHPRDLQLNDLLLWLQHTGEDGGPADAFALEAIGLHRGTPDEQRIALAIGRSTATLSARLIGSCARAYFTSGLNRRAIALLEGIEDPDARVLAAEIAAMELRAPDALGELGEALANKLEVLGGSERLQRWRRGIFGSRPPPTPKPSVTILWHGIRWYIAFAREPVLGRSDAEIVVRAPIVSRKHLGFQNVDGIPTVQDLGSTHGTFRRGARLIERVAVVEPLELALGGSIPCRVERAASVFTSDVALIVEVGLEKHVLAFGPLMRLGSLELVREGLRLILRAPTDGFFFAGMSSRLVEAELGPSDAICMTDGAAPVLVVDPESFEAVAV